MKYNIFSILFITFCAIVLLPACNNPRIKEEASWGKIYKNLGIDSAAFEISEQSKERVYFYNKSKGNTPIAPGNTFHLMIGLIALERDIVSNEDEVIAKDTASKWDGDLTLRTAFKANNNEAFKNLARKIGFDEMKIWLDTVRYGNKMLKAPIDMAWENNTLKITPDEQVGFLKRLYFDALPFSTRSQKIMRSMMKIEDKMKYRLYAKSGVIQDGAINKFLQIGYLEDSTSHPYFFANSFDYTSTQNADSLGKLTTTAIFNTMDLLRIE
jgi:beta-lactamase class D